jgi:ATP-dependent exoDNAse (exonuclease V) alpha subunit
MLPLILGYSLSIHKLQGSTCERVILNPGKKKFAPGLLLVVATRTKSFEDSPLISIPTSPGFNRSTTQSH